MCFIKRPATFYGWISILFKRMLWTGIIMFLTSDHKDKFGIPWVRKMVGCQRKFVFTKLHVKICWFFLSNRAQRANSYLIHFAAVRLRKTETNISDIFNMQTFGRLSTWFWKKAIYCSAILIRNKISEYCSNSFRFFFIVIVKLAIISNTMYVRPQ